MKGQAKQSIFKSIIKGINKFLAIFGIRLVKAQKNSANLLKDRLSRHLHKGYLHEDEAFEAIQLISSNTMLTYDPLVSLYEQTIYFEVNSIEGDFVECGTWKGGAVGIMALANLKYGKFRRQIHLFDAFEEICQPDEKHDESKLVKEVKKLSNTSEFSNTLAPLKGIYDQYGGPGTLEICKFLLEEKIKYPPDYLKYHKGWFQNTVPVIAPSIQKIAILRLDGDWYESTKVCLEHLLNKVVKGGIVIIDDYGYNEGCRKAVHEILKNHQLNPYINHIDAYCKYFFKI